MLASNTITVWTLTRRNDKSNCRTQIPMRIISLTNLLLTSIIFCLQISCIGETSENEKTWASVALPPLPNGTPQNNSIPEINRYNFVIYSTLLEKIFYNEGDFDKFGGNDLLLFESHTVFPSEVSRLVSDRTISKELIKNFEEVNQESEKLLNKYDVKALVESISGSQSLEELFSRTQKQRPKTKAIVGFSKIGFDPNMSRAIIYLEYFSAEKKLQKFYFLILLQSKIVAGKLYSIEITEIKKLS